MYEFGRQQNTQRKDMKLFGSILKDVKNGKFLPMDINCEKNFAEKDTKAFYKKNLEIMPADWEYRNKNVTYTINKDYYRTSNFKTIDWANSIVIFGCSYVFGVGIDDNDTITEQLSKLTNRPVINMGSPGSSITYNFHNNLILKNHYPTPYAVVNVWTNYYRDIIYYKKSVNNIGSWSKNIEYAKILFSEEDHIKTEGYFNILATKTIWSNTKYVDFTYFPESAKVYGLNLIHITDKARDLQHPGSQSLKAGAEYIMNKL
jgi:hypothetical protein